MSLFVDLERHYFFHVGFAFVIAGWLLVQVADIVTDSFICKR